MGHGALSDLSVVELAQGVAGPYCTKLLADLGADVIKAEPPEGDRSRRQGPFPGNVADPERSGQFLYLNANKRSIRIDLGSSEDRATVRELVSGADLMIVDVPPSSLEALGLDYGSLSTHNSRLIMVHITPFGAIGPYRDFVGTALTTYHIGGMGWESPHNVVTDLESQPPLAPAGYLAEYMTGITAAASTMVALSYRDAYGAGQYVDISGFESVANGIRQKLAGLSTGSDMSRAPRGKSGLPYVLPCKDGYISTAIVRDNWWRTIKKIMGNPEWAENELFDTQPGRHEHADMLEHLFTEWLGQYSREEIQQLALKHRVPGFPVLSIAELLTSPQHVFRRYFVEVEQPLAGKVTQPGPPAVYSRTPATIERPAPLLGEHSGEIRAQLAGRPIAGGDVGSLEVDESAAGTGGDRPLDGIRITDFGQILAVPHATSWLATLGAEVIRIESQVSPDFQQRVGGQQGIDGIPGLNRNLQYTTINFGKKSVLLNLKTPRGIELAKELVRHSDVVAENFVAGTMERMGLNYEVLRNIKPDIIMLSSSAVGQHGPERTAAGFGANTTASAGLPYVNGYAGGPPMGIEVNFPDLLVAAQNVQAVLAALHERRRTGQGQHIDISMADVVMPALAEAILDYTMNGRESVRIGNRNPTMAPHGVYRCSGDDAWVAISVTGDREWRGLRRALAAPPWAAEEKLDHVQGRLEHQDEIDRELTHWTRQLDHYDVMHRLQAEGVAAAPVLSAMRVASDPQFRALGYLVEVEHKETGKRLFPGFPGRYSGMPRLDYRGAPLVGEHTEEIFRGLLGRSREEFDELVATQVIY